MANGQGGARIGAGRKKKALADNIADGNPGKRKLTVLDFTDDAADLHGQTMPPPKAFFGRAAEKTARISLPCRSMRKHGNGWPSEIATD